MGAIVLLAVLVDDIGFSGAFHRRRPGDDRFTEEFRAGAVRLVGGAVFLLCLIPFWTSYPPFGRCPPNRIKPSRAVRRTTLRRVMAAIPGT